MHLKKIANAEMKSFKIFQMHSQYIETKLSIYVVIFPQIIILIVIWAPMCSLFSLPDVQVHQYGVRLVCPTLFNGHFHYILQ